MQWEKCGQSQIAPLQIGEIAAVKWKMCGDFPSNPLERDLNVGFSYGGSERNGTSLFFQLQYRQLFRVAWPPLVSGAALA